MGLISKTVKVKWNGNNKKWFVEKGYVYTKLRDEFEIRVEDLINGSRIKVEVKCDNCGKIFDRDWRDYKKYIYPNDKSYCNRCTSKIYGGKQISKARLKKGKSFEEWCLTNNYKDLLELWDYDKNKCSPDEVNYATNKKYYFKCPRGIHESELKQISNYTRRKTTLHCKKCNSFEQWCIDNNQLILLSRWDYKLNSKTPGEVNCCDGKQYYLKCPRELHESELKRICDYTYGHEGAIECNQCNSFETWCYENLSQEKAKEILSRWDYGKNIDKNGNVIKPSDINCHSNGFNKKGYWFKCLKHLEHESELKNIKSFTNGQEGSMGCKACNSFAQWGIDNLGNDFLEKYWDYEKNKISPWEIDKCSNKKKVWIKCQEKYYHIYDILPNSFVNGQRCGFCKGSKVHSLDSLGNLFPISLKLWSDENKKSPYEYTPMGNDKVWWKCPDCEHKDFFREVSVSNRYQFRCPECTRERNESFLQEKIRIYLNELGYEILHEHKCNIIAKNPKTKGGNNTMPYDNEVVELKLIVEAHGIQHYIVDKFNFKTTNKNHINSEHSLHQRQLYDRYKRLYAKSQGYNYLEIPYWTDNKLQEYKKLIDDKIREILNK